MKRIYLTLMFVLCSFYSYAQKTPHAIGFHFGGSTIDFTYQYHFNNKNFIDVTAGVFDFDDGFLAQGVYNWNIKEWSNWTPRFGTWKFWGGFGAGVGFIDGESKNNFMLGPVGNLGFGFTLNCCPLSLGVDYRPMVALSIGDDTELIDRAFRNVGLTLTYRF